MRRIIFNILTYNKDKYWICDEICSIGKIVGTITEEKKSVDCDVGFTITEILDFFSDDENNKIAFD